MADELEPLKPDELVKATEPHSNHLAKQGLMRDADTITDKQLKTAQTPVLNAANAVVKLKLARDAYRAKWRYKDTLRADKWAHKDKVRQMRKERRELVKSRKEAKQALKEERRKAKQIAKEEKRRTVKTLKEQKKSEKSANVPEARASKTHSNE